MKLSEQLKQDHVSGDYGQGLEGYSCRALVLEEALEEAATSLEGCRYSEMPLARKLRQILADNNA